MSSADDSEDLVEIQYFALKASLILNITEMKQEMLLLQLNNKRTEKNVIISELHDMADRREALIDIAKQVLKKDDFAQYKDLIKEGLAVYSKKFDFKKMRWKYRDY